MNPLTSDQVPMFNYLNSKSRSYLTRHLPNGYCRAIAKYGPKNLAKVSVVEQAIITPVLRCLVQMINCNLPDYKCICRIELVLTTVYHTVWVTHCELATTALSLSFICHCNQYQSQRGSKESTKWKEDSPPPFFIQNFLSLSLSRSRIRPLSVCSCWGPMLQNRFF